MYSDGSFSVPTSLLIIAEATVFTAWMLSLILCVTSITKERALLEPLEIPIILKDIETVGHCLWKAEV